MSGNKVFVGRLTGLNEVTIREYFLKYDPNQEMFLNIQRGFACITFSDVSIAQNILQERHIIQGREVDVKKFVQDSKLKEPNANPVAVYKQAHMQELPQNSRLLYSEFLDFFYRPTVVEPFALVIIWKRGEFLGFGFINRTESEGFPTSEIYMALKSEIAKVVEIVRQNHCVCHQGCQLQGTQFAPKMGTQDEQVTRLSNFPDAKLYYRPASARVILKQLVSLSIPKHDFTRVSEGYRNAREFNLLTIDYDRAKGECGFGIVPAAGEGGARDPGQTARILRKIIGLIETGVPEGEAGGQMQQLVIHGPEGAAALTEDYKDAGAANSELERQGP